MSRITLALRTYSSRARGGRGHRTATFVKRVPNDFLSELDNLISIYQNQCDTSDSPRYHFLRQFLSEIDDLLPSDSSASKQ